MTLTLVVLVAVWATGHGVDGLNYARLGTSYLLIHNCYQFVLYGRQMTPRVSCTRANYNSYIVIYYVWQHEEEIRKTVECIDFTAWSRRTRNKSVVIIIIIMFICKAPSIRTNFRSEEHKIHCNTQIQNITIYIPVKNNIKNTNSRKTRLDLRGARRLP